MENDKLVVYKTFSNTLSANIVKGLLDSYGVPSFVAEQSMIWGASFFNEAIGGVRLMVRAEDVGKIKALLDLDAENKDTEDNSVFLPEEGV